MNKAEFTAWKAHTKASRFTWTLDPVHNGKNGQDYLFHRGGESGQYISVKNGDAIIGNFEGAYPHIGEAMFTPVYSKQFADDTTAFMALIKNGGFSFLKRHFIPTVSNQIVY